MAPRAYIRVRDTTGAIKAIFTANGADGGENGYFNLVWKKQVNDVWLATFEIAQSNPDIQYIVDKYQLEVVRSDPAIGLTEYVSFDGQIRDDQPYTDEIGHNRLKITAYGGMALASRRRVAYYANKANYTIFSSVKGETVLKRLVRDNCDPTFATTGNLRDRTPNTIGLTIATDQLRGNTINWTCGGRSLLLDELKKVAQIAGGDYNIVRTGLATYAFEFYPGQLGTDRTSGTDKVVFSLDRGNMKTPKLVRARNSESTVVIIGGKGEEDARVIRTRNGPNFSVTNDIETFIDGRNTTDVNALDALGDQSMQALKYRNQLEFEVIQTQYYTVEQKYFLGDLTLAQYYGVTITQQVYALTFEYNGPHETVDVVMRTL